MVYETIYLTALFELIGWWILFATPKRPKWQEKWKPERKVSAYPCTDNKVTAVNVNTSHSVIKPSIVKLCLLSIENKKNLWTFRTLHCWRFMDISCFIPFLSCFILWIHFQSRNLTVCLFNFIRNKSSLKWRYSCFHVFKTKLQLKDGTPFS